MHPFAAQLAVVEAADQGGVLARHGRLVAVAVERPGLHLRLCQLAAVQQVMERMLVVIALGADGADRRLEFGNRHRLLRFALGALTLQAYRFGHRRTSMPSYPTSHPAPSMDLRAGEFSSSAGFELFICTYMSLPTPSFENAAIDPEAPDMLIWPIRAPVLLSSPCSIISSSVNKVPSKKTMDAPCRRAASFSSTAAQPGNVKEGLLLGRISNLEADGVAFLAAEVGGGLVLQVERDLAGHGEGFDRQPQIDAGALQLERLDRARSRCAARAARPAPGTPSWRAACASTRSEA